MKIYKEGDPAIEKYQRGIIVLIAVMLMLSFATVLWVQAGAPMPSIQINYEVGGPLGDAINQSVTGLEQMYEDIKSIG